MRTCGNINTRVIDAQKLLLPENNYTNKLLISIKNYNMVNR